MKNPFPCQRYRPMPVSRRDMLRRSASGFGAMALAALGLDPAYGADGGGKALHGPHHKATAKNVIFLYMDGGPSQIDTFDPKPLLDKYNGKERALGSSNSTANQACPSAACSRTWRPVPMI